MVLFFSMLSLYAPIFQIKRNISSEKWFNEVVTFFSENAKNLGRSDDAKRRKKRGWPKRVRQKRTLTSRRRKQLLQSLNARAVFFQRPLQHSGNAIISLGHCITTLF